jgi:uncharacterized membrane protein
MELSIKIGILLFATLLTGLSAGLCFTWANAVTSGIGRLDDLNYLRAFQHMNRTILNPLFFVVFFGPVFLSLASTYAYKSYPAHILWLLLAATVFYFFGVALVTVFGNVPLNELLDKTDLQSIDLESAKSLRAKFETKWNNLHLIRTICSALSFLLLLLVCLLKNKGIPI